ncbi:MAG TPA: hypothetical protein PKX60_06110, partial [Prolixibacteraceae bacterium]|nr:hypothetical protein [Prolixibacteraceae bacterium]
VPSPELVEGVPSPELVEGVPSPELVEGEKWGAIILAVAHYQFLSLDLKAHKEAGAVIYDVKGILEKELTDGRL